MSTFVHLNIKIEKGYALSVKLLLRCLYPKYTLLVLAKNFNGELAPPPFPSQANFLYPAHYTFDKSSASKAVQVEV